MKKAYCLILLFIIAFTSCTARPSPTVRQQPIEPRTTQTELLSTTQPATPPPTSTLVEITVTPSVTATVTRMPTETPFVETYPLKQVWIEFGSTEGYHADYDLTFPVSIPNWILYTDGTILLYRNETLLTKQLTENETCALLTRIEQLGFYKIMTDGIDYRGDPIYVNVPPEKLHTDDAYEYFIVNGATPKSLWVYEPIKEYVIQPVMNIMNGLRNYAPTGLQPDSIDRLGLFIQFGRPYEALNSLKANPWPFDPALLTNRNEFGSVYIEGETAAQVYQVFKTPYTRLVFTVQDQEYTVTARPLLRHERRTSYGVEPNFPEPAAEFEPPFNCK